MHQEHIPWSLRDETCFLIWIGYLSNATVETNLSKDGNTWGAIFSKLTSSICFAFIRYIFLKLHGKMRPLLCCFGCPKFLSIEIVLAENKLCYRHFCLEDVSFWQIDYFRISLYK